MRYFYIMLIIGLGNPGKEYEGTRHNSGRESVFYFAKKQEFPDFELNKKALALVAESKIGKERVMLVLPETFMNKSGSAVGKLIKPQKTRQKHSHLGGSAVGREMKNVVVIHDDIDILLGKIKISYGKNSGGHKGVESVMRALKTKNFIRIRIGICPVSGRKPDHKEQMKFIVGKWKPTERTLIKKSFARTAQALETIITNSLERAMSEANQ